MTLEGGCSDKFKQSLLDFFVERAVLLRSTRKLLHLDEECAGTDGSGLLEKVAANISGITLQQLKVI